MKVKKTTIGGSTQSKQYFKEEPKNQSLRIMQSHIFNSDIRGERSWIYYCG